MTRATVAALLAMVSCSREPVSSLPSATSDAHATTSSTGDPSASAAPRTPSSAPVASNAPTWLDAFNAYPGARHLCSEHVSGNNMHIEWSSYATADQPGDVAEFYRRPAKGYREEKGQSDPTFAADADRKLTVSASNGEYPKCAEAPTATEKTVIVVSKATR